MVETPIAAPIRPAWITEPGVYQLSDAEYHSDPVVGGSLSSTGARRLLPPSCPAKFKWLKDHPVVKDEFDFGKAAHNKVLGIGAEIMTLEYDSWRSDAAQAERDEIRAAGMVPLLEKDAMIVDAMADALRAHPLAGRLFIPGRGIPEQTLVWRDRTTGIMRRALLDWRQQNLIADYKTAAHGDPAACEKTIHNYGYHCQGDWYRDGVYELGLVPQGRRVQFVFVFQEKTPPYMVTVVEPNEESLLWGSVLNAKACDVYRQCVETDTWPAWAIPGSTETTDTGLVLSSLPPYAVTSYERARERGEYDVEGLSIR